jgi:hypothetical protein
VAVGDSAAAVVDVADTVVTEAVIVVALVVTGEVVVVTEVDSVASEEVAVETVAASAVTGEVVTVASAAASEEVAVVVVSAATDAVEVTGEEEVALAERGESHAWSFESRRHDRFRLKELTLSCTIHIPPAPLCERARLLR